MKNYISNWFTRDEVACKCGCGFDTMDAETLMIADAVREHVGKSITPNSGARCAAHNETVGGSPNSQHLIARAMDLPVDDPKEVYNWLCGTFPGRYGFGRYKTFVHVDSRRGPARWETG